MVLLGSTSRCIWVVPQHGSAHDALLEESREADSGKLLVLVLLVPEVNDWFSRALDLMMKRGQDLRRLDMLRNKVVFR